MVERHAVRAVVLSAEGKILLAQMRLSDRSFWCMPGGGIQVGESVIDALLRELIEEVGDRSWKIGEEIWYRSHRFDFEGEAYLQHERFFVVPSDEFEPPSQMNDAEEQQYFGQYRWWTASEIAVSSEIFEPEGLPVLLPAVVQSIPPQPIHIGSHDGA